MLINRTSLAFQLMVANMHSQPPALRELEAAYQKFGMMEEVLSMIASDGKDGLRTIEECVRYAKDALSFDPLA